MTANALTEHPDIQGLIFRGYKALDYAGYGLFRITDRQTFQAWLKDLLDRDLVSTAQHRQPEGRTVTRLNIALTAGGMKRLLGDHWLADTFEPAFLEGMAADHRSRLLGDVEANDPKHWRWGRKAAFDGLLMVFAPTKGEAEALLAGHLRSGNGTERSETLFGHLGRLDDAGNYVVDGKEAFGFADGVSQPIFEGTQRHRERPGEAALHGIPVGEVILGYPDGTGRLPRSPAASAACDPRGHLAPHWEWPERRDLGRNGSYLVFRQLAQDRKAFRGYLETAATDGKEDSVQALAEKMVGRREDGSAMAPSAKPKADENNLFDFTDDEKGLFCPIGSHIRRSNPRASGLKNPKAALEVTQRHRILRRGRNYSGGENGEEGLQFLCFNASIARQFEFIQASWCNNQFFDGLQREVDPIIGTPRAACAGLESVDRFTIPRHPYRRLLSGLPRFVTVKGGGYFFMPAISALRCLAEVS